MISFVERINFHLSSFFMQLPVYIHAPIELIALIVIGVELGMKLQWMGWLTILRHKRTMIKVN